MTIADGNDEYLNFCFNEAVMIAGNNADNRYYDEARARAEAEAQNDQQTKNFSGVLSGGAQRDPRLGTNHNQRSMGLQPQNDGANIWSSPQGTMIAGTIPFIGRQE